MSVHNGQAFLREAVDSILAQTYSDFELIVVEDASTDRTADILNSYGDPRLRVISLGKNVGLADALNLALDNAHGEFIARMDADDVAYPRRFESQLALFHAYPEVVVLGSCYDLIDKNSTRFDTCQVKLNNRELQSALLYENQFCHPSVMMRRESLVAVGGYRCLGGRYAQDYDLWLRLAERGDLMNSGQPLLMYRFHDGQVSVSKTTEQRYAAELYKELALQRRVGGMENVRNARLAVRARKREIGVAVANDLLSIARHFEELGLRREAYAMKWRAAFVAPLSQPVRGLLRNWVHQHWPRIRP